MNITLEQIQIKLAEAINTSGLTQKDIAEKIGVRQQQISCYLHGQKMPALDTLANLCVVLDLDANDILCVNDNSNNGYKTYISNSFNNNSNNSGNFNP